ncbi:hypothetical protein HD553DRAFT_338617 [Filobasidium floriforme]|uniref:uncharacterized protein n=1 Tax=Filobasidium floriforme TaxID=5210 RepID=UPI001E8E26BC|nr:uncharacterized protein HD553DRAFT_338617 [Filobasidium floriforme]KAH8090906.1 hypothetical protein HD553DRAFT_338617 [Filobasidium floriforme]
MSGQDSPHLILVIWDDGGGEVKNTSPGWEAREVKAIKRQVEHSLSLPDLEMGHIDIMLNSETVVAEYFRYMEPFTNVRVLSWRTLLPGYLLPVFQETVKHRSSSGRQVIACILSYLPLEDQHPSTYEALKSNPDIHSIHFWHKKHAWTRQSFNLQDSQIGLRTSASQRLHTPSSHGDAVETPESVKVASTSTVVAENDDWTAEGELRKR